MPALARILPGAWPWMLLAAGALVPLSLAPFGLWPLGIGAVALWALAVRGVEVRRGMWLGWCFGLGQYGVGVSWVYVSIHRYGHAPEWLAGALVALFVAGMAVFGAARGGLTAWIEARTGRPGLALLVGWLAVDGSLTWVLTGFPWLFLGYGHVDTWLGGWAPVGGAQLVTAWVVVSGIAVAALVHWRRGDPAARAARPPTTPAPTPVSRLLLAMLVLLGWGGGALLVGVEWTTVRDVRTVALVQGNVDQDRKWRRDTVRETLELYRDLSDPYWGRDLVIWPEAAVTLFEHQARDWLDAMAARATPGTLVTGIPGWAPDPDGTFSFRNLAVVAGARSATASPRADFEPQGDARGETAPEPDAGATYRKRRLVPFGEYVPLEGLLRGMIEFFDLPMSRARPGPEAQAPLQAGDMRLTPAICYEIAYSGLLRSVPGDVIVTLSNDAWFGESIGPDQHLEIARMRALEFSRWVLRATNDGHTAIIDARGQVRAQLPRFVPAVLDGTFELRDGATPFQRFGDRGLFVAAMVAVAIAWWMRARSDVRGSGEPGGSG